MALSTLSGPVATIHVTAPDVVVSPPQSLYATGAASGDDGTTRTLISSAGAPTACTDNDSGTGLDQDSQSLSGDDSAEERATLAQVLGAARTSRLTGGSLAEIRMRQRHHSVLLESLLDPETCVLDNRITTPDVTWETPREKKHQGVFSSLRRHLPHIGLSDKKRALKPWSSIDLITESVNKAEKSAAETRTQVPRRKKSGRSASCSIPSKTK